jgi:hypothetical protein
MGEPELEGIQDLPPLSSYVLSFKFWYYVARFPLLFILLNGLVFINLFAIEKDEMEMIVYSEYSRESQVQSMSKRNLLLVAIMSFVDSIVLYRAALFMVKEVGLLEARETENEATSTSTSASTPSMHHVHAQASLNMDRFLSRGRKRPHASFFVNLLYLATFVALATSLVCFALRVFVGTSKAAVMCFDGHEADNATPPIDGVPDDLQKWAKNPYRYWGGGAHLTYAHMVDGMTYFVGSNASSTSVTDTDDDNSENIPTLMAVGLDGRIRSFSDVSNPQWLTTVGGESALASEAFCSLYYTPSNFRRHDGRHTTRVLCVAASEDISHGFRNISLTWSDRRRSADPISTKVHNSELWVLVQFYSFEDHYARTNYEIYKLHPKTMQVSSIANFTLNDGAFHLGETKVCFRWAVAIVSVVGATVLAPASLWMLKVRNISAGVVPVCIALIALISLLSETLAEGIGFLTVIALIISLLGTASPWTGREVLVWALYSTLAVLVAINLGEAGSIGAMVLGVIVGLILDHPVLQFVGWLVGIVTLCFGIFNLILIPIGIVVSCGMVSVGYALTRYRQYLVYSTRRLWRMMRTSRENMADQQPHGDDMTRGLLDHRS